MTRPGPVGHGSGARGTPRLTLSDLLADGPDEMGRELAGGPAAVEATLAGLRPDLPALRHELVHGSRIHVVGTGASLAMARLVEPLWRSAGGSPIVVREASAVVFASDGHRFGPGEVAIAVSKSGGSPETLAAARLARAGGARVLALTTEADSRLAQVADRVVTARTGAERGAATVSELATAAALLALGGMLDADTDASERLAGRLAALAADWGWAAERGMRLASARQTWILGSGAGLGVAEAGTLLWQEKVRRAAVATTPSEFRHGPIEAVTRRDAIVLIASRTAGPLEREYVELLGREVAALGPAVLAVDPAAGSEAELALCALLRVQQLARATAHAAGTYRDGFRVLRSIVRPAGFLAR